MTCDMEIGLKPWKCMLATRAVHQAGPCRRSRGLGSFGESNVQTKRMRIQSLFVLETMSYSGLPDPGDGKGTSSRGLLAGPCR